VVKEGKGKNNELDNNLQTSRAIKWQASRPKKKKREIQEGNRPQGERKTQVTEGSKIYFHHHYLGGRKKD